MSDERKELTKYFDNMCLFLANHGWTEKDERAGAIRNLIQQKPEKYFVIIKIKEYGEVTNEIRHYDTKGEAEAWVNKLRIAEKNKYCGFEILETFFYEGRVI